MEIAGQFCVEINKLFNWWRQIQRNELIPGRWQQGVCLLAHPAMNDVGVDSVCKRYAGQVVLRGS